LDDASNLTDARRQQACAAAAEMRLLMSSTWINIHVGEYGFLAELVIVQDGIAVDISDYSTLTFVFTKPDGTEVEKTAAFATDGVDGLLSYLVEDGLIDASGIWKVWAQVEKAGVELTSRTLRFNVRAVGA
jgi:hypothetical protein